MLSFALVIASCSTATEAPPEPEVQEVAELVMWHMGISESYIDWWDGFVAEFNDANPDINVSHEIFESEAYGTKWAAATAADELPDIWWVIPGPAAWDVYDDGKILSLENSINTDRMTGAAIDGCTHDGHLLCVPAYFAPVKLYYNEALLADAGVDPNNWSDPLQPTWDEFLATCEALKQNGKACITVGNADNWPGMFWYFAIQDRLGGLDELYAALAEGGTFQSESFTGAVEVIQDLNDNGYFIEGFNGVTSNDSQTIFTQGDAGFVYQGSWLLGHIADAAPEGFEFGILDFPSFADGDPNSQSDIHSGIESYWISSNTEYPDAAAKLLNAFLDADTQSDFVAKTQSVPATTGIQAPSDAADEAIWLLAALTERSTGGLLPFLSQFVPGEIRQPLMSMDQAVFSGDITPEEFVAELDKAAGR